MRLRLETRLKTIFAAGSRLDEYVNPTSSLLYEGIHKEHKEMRSCSTSPAVGDVLSVSSCFSWYPGVCPYLHIPADE